MTYARAWIYDEPIAAAPPHIGTLNEGSLHAALKARYAQPGDELEVRLDGFIIDIRRPALLVEIQTSSFASLGKKLDRPSIACSWSIPSPSRAQTPNKPIALGAPHYIRHPHNTLSHTPARVHTPAHVRNSGLKFLRVGEQPRPGWRITCH